MPGESSPTDILLWWFFFPPQSFTCFPCKELCLLSKKLHPCFSWFSLVSFFTKIHHADIVLSSKYLRAAVHSLHCLLWNELSPFSLWHKNLSGVSSCHLWSPSCAGQVLSPAQWNHLMDSLLGNDFPTDHINQVSDQISPLKSVLKEKCATALIDTKLITTSSLCPGNYLPRGERLSPSYKVSTSHTKYQWIRRQTNLLVNPKFSSADATLRTGLCPAGRAPQPALKRLLWRASCLGVWAKNDKCSEWELWGAFRINVNNFIPLKIPLMTEQH